MLKKLLAAILISGICCYAQAQYKKIDSLKRLLANSRADSTTVLLTAELAHSYLYYKPDSCLLLAKNALFAAKKINFTRGEGRAYKQIGDALEQMGNYPGAMTAYLKHLRIAETLKLSGESVQALINIGLLYDDQGEYRQAINYALKAKSVIDAIKDKTRIKHYDLNKEVILLNAGYLYYKLNLPDSALIYEQDAYQLNVSIHDEDNVDDILLNLGLIQEKFNNNTLALTYLRMGMQKSAVINDYATLTHCFLRIAEYYKMIVVNTDSSIYYAKKALACAQKAIFTKGIFEASTELAKIYGSFDKATAYDYLSIANTANDSLFNEEKIRQLQNLKFEEQIREQEVAELKAQHEEDQKEHLQLSAIALFIPLFFMILLVLSKIKVHHRVIETMSILSILFLFEFVTLLLHSLIGNVSQHTPYIEFIAFVCIAAIMIPLHHRFNHWLIERLTKLRKWGKHNEVPVKITEGPQ